jgi:hypothetical protein
MIKALTDMLGILITWPGGVRTSTRLEIVDELTTLPKFVGQCTLSNRGMRVVFISTGIYPTCARYVPMPTARRLRP